MLRLRLIAFAVALLTIPIPTRAQVPTPASVDYDSIMQLDWEGRVRVFNQITAENKAELARTQITRWVEQNRARLTPQQRRVMDENLAFVTAELYRKPMNPELVAKQKEVEARTAAVFSTEDMRQALTLHATYIPKN